MIPTEGWGKHFFIKMQRIQKEGAEADMAPKIKQMGGGTHKLTAI